MRAGFIESAGIAYFRDDADEPRITMPDQVKIRVKVTGICGSELHAYHGAHPWRIPPVISGHEFSGTICEIGSAVTNCKVGDRVTAEPQYGCGKCRDCKNGRYNICSKKRVLGATYWSGSFGEYIVVPEKCVVKLADNVSFENGALIEPLAVGMHAIRENGIQKGGTLAIIGCGTIGLGILLCAKCFSPQTVIAIDILDFNLQKAKEMGADYCINSQKEDVITRISEVTGGEFVDITFIAFGSAESVKQAAQITRPGGVLSEIAIMEDCPAPFSTIQVKEQKIVGSNMYVSDDFRLVANYISSGKIKLNGFNSRALRTNARCNGMGG